MTVVVVVLLVADAAGDGRTVRPDQARSRQHIQRNGPATVARMPRSSSDGMENVPVGAAVRAFFVQIDEDSGVSQSSPSCSSGRRSASDGRPPRSYVSQSGVSDGVRRRAGAHPWRRDRGRRRERRLTAIASSDTPFDQADRFLLDQLNCRQWPRLKELRSLLEARTDHGLGPVGKADIVSPGELGAWTPPPPLRSNLIVGRRKETMSTAVKKGRFAPGSLRLGPSCFAVR